MAELKFSLRDTLLKLLDEKRYYSLRDLFNTMNPADIAAVFEELDPEQTVMLFRLLPKETAAEAFAYMTPEVQEQVITALTDVEVQGVLDSQFMDDTVDMLEEMPANVVHRIIANTTPEKRSAVNALLQYPRDSAGSGMTTEFVELKTQMTAADVFKKIKRSGIDRETIYDCYVTDRSRRLIGVLSIKDLLITKAENPTVGELMQTEPISANVLDSEEEVARRLQKYGFLAMPIVDNENRLVGILTYDDSMHVLSENDSEDMEIMAAMTPSEKTYLKSTPFDLFKHRIPWLMLLMVSATFTGMIITSFEDALSLLPVLTAFIPMLMDTGGNCGSQSSVTVIRALSLDELHFTDLFRVMWKEARTAVLCGAALAAACFLKILLVDRLLMGNESISLLVNGVVCLTLCVTVILAKFVGCTLPLFAKRLGFDPAVMASPFITTIVDALSLLVYFLFAKLLLGV